MSDELLVLLAAVGNDGCWRNKSTRFLLVPVNVKEVLASFAVSEDELPSRVCASSSVPNGNCGSSSPGCLLPMNCRRKLWADLASSVERERER